MFQDRLKPCLTTFSIYAVGVIVESEPQQVTLIPLGVPKTGQMTEAMGMEVAHNIAIEKLALQLLGLSLVAPLAVLSSRDIR